MQRELSEKLDLWDLKDPLESPVLRVCVESPALWVNKDFLVLQVKTALLDLSDLLDSPV